MKANLSNKIDLASLLQRLWQSIVKQVEQATLVPAWFPWRHPAAGYVVAVFLQIVAACIISLVVHMYPSFAFAGLLALLIVALVALNWGSGPSLLATVAGAILLDALAIPPYFIWSLSDRATLLGIALFLCTGVTISIVAHQIERGRRAREQLLSQTNQTMNDFLSMAGHELKHPLTTSVIVLQLAQRLVQHLQDDPQKFQQKRTELDELLQKVEQQIKLQNRLVDDLLDITRIRTHTLHLFKRECDLSRTIREAVTAIQQTTPERTIQLRVPEEAVMTFADPERIEQVITNYVTNALKYSPESGQVEVTLHVEKEIVRLSVRDEGPGLSPVAQREVWERFYRGTSSQERSSKKTGLGLGLYVCRMLIEQHQGQVGVESEQGVGSTFWFTLPLHNPSS